MRRWWFLILLILSTAPAHAGTKDMVRLYQHFVGDADTKDVNVRGFELPPGAFYTHVLIGDGGKQGPHIVMMTCTPKECNGRSQWLGESGATIQSVGLIDLHGTATAEFASHEPYDPYGNYVKLTWTNTPAKKNRHAVIAVSTMRTQAKQSESRFGGMVNGTERRGKLWLLEAQAQQSGSVFSGETVDLAATGAGTTTSYSLEREAKVSALKLRAAERRMPENRSACLPGKPVIFFYILNANRYEPPSLEERPFPHGC
jgi:hypothetical protein